MSNTSLSTFEIIRNLISEITVIPSEVISLESSFFDDFKMDELDFLIVVMAIESEFDIYIHDKIIAGFRVIKNIVDYIDKDKAVKSNMLNLN